MITSQELATFGQRFIRSTTRKYGARGACSAPWRSEGFPVGVRIDREMLSIRAVLFRM
jgi:hypothetical protein